MNEKKTLRRVVTPVVTTSLLLSCGAATGLDVEDVGGDATTADATAPSDAPFSRDSASEPDGFGPAGDGADGSASDSHGQEPCGALGDPCCIGSACNGALPSLHVADDSSQGAVQILDR